MLQYNFTIMFIIHSITPVCMDFEGRLLLQFLYFSAGSKNETCQFNSDTTSLTRASHLSSFQT